jgi:uncharacterized repeat protein (TIGR04076 family)
MAFRDLKITVINPEGRCGRSKDGVTFFVRNGMLEVPPGERVCLFALGSIMPALSGAILKTEPGEGMLDLQKDWQCPDPEGRVTFRIEPAA